MALRFGAATNDRVDCASGTSIDDVPEWSIGVALNMTTLTNNRVVIAKHDGATNGWTCRLTGTTGNVVVFWNRATTNLIYATNSTPLATTGSWLFFGFTMSQSGSVVTMYHGSLFGDTLTAATFGTAQAGSGTFNTDASQTLQIGNRGTDTAAIQADIGWVGWYNKVFSQAEFESLLSSFRPTVSNGKALLYIPLGLTGTGSQLDRSGNANHGTISGPTQVAGPAYGLWDRHLLAA